LFKIELDTLTSCFNSSTLIPVSPEVVFESVVPIIISKPLCFNFSVRSRSKSDASTSVTCTLFVAVDEANRESKILTKQVRAFDDAGFPDGSIEDAVDNSMRLRTIISVLIELNG
jgi:hypothetical protein